MSAHWEIRQGDVLDRLREMPHESVQCCITSPPYYGLRDYGIEGQIGLEETPGEYVRRLVEVFGEVKRVLRDDGTLWLNLGDSYSHGAHAKRNTDVKPKDLLGIPWMVAFALHQPYYAGRIRDERDRLWLAAMLDTEGNIAVNLHRAGQGERVRDGFGVSVKVHNASRALVERCALVAGAGSVRCHDTRSGRPIYVWAVYSDEARRVLREVYPHLVAKQHEARLAFGRQNRDGYDALRLLHGGSHTTLDAPAPPSCLEPGWYLRRDIIWSKPNPMPESVKDRPTGVHEYVFLLAKSPRYYYDAHAIREEGKDWSRGGPGTGILTTEHYGSDNGGNNGLAKLAQRYRDGTAAVGRNKRSVWEVPTVSYDGAHFATFPPRLVEPMVDAGSRPGDLVLDPFAGSGTTLQVAVARGRDALGIELNPEYIELAQRRLAGVTAPLFGECAA